MATTLAWISRFDKKLEDWIQYSEQLEHFFNANNIVDANKKGSGLLTVIRPTACKLV